MAQLLLKRPIIFFDLETTGTDAAKDRIVELALVKLLTDGTRDKYVKRINPGMPIPASSTAIHGISDEDVKDCPHFKQIAKDLFEWMKGCDLGGYASSKFDIPLLAEEFLRAGVNVDFTDRHMIDVQQIFFKMESRTLSAAYNFYCDKTLENAHSAEADIMATIEVLEAQLDRYNDLSHEVKALHEFTGGEQFVDYARRIVMKDGHPVFNFGKHKGRKVEDIFTEEPQYYDWMMQADFALHTKQKISEILNRMKLQKSGLKTNI
ncbi:3'-5' exonuclease [Polluticoccus soli]|uniref:3'-5' exonuclease n=1 Tax=Polluticoccus soli TaxID=3034150 RepID=UPI0023E325AB|nr:3'-5' exonuclease [Flavipsychrobacter sp. JY13-12]